MEEEEDEKEEVRVSGNSATSPEDKEIPLGVCRNVLRFLCGNFIMHPWGVLRRLRSRMNSAPFEHATQRKEKPKEKPSSFFCTFRQHTALNSVCRNVSWPSYRWFDPINRTQDGFRSLLSEKYLPRISNPAKLIMHKRTRVWRLYGEHTAFNRGVPRNYERRY